MLKQQAQFDLNQSQPKALTQTLDSVSAEFWLLTLAFFFAGVFYFWGYYFWAYLGRVLTG